MTEENEYLDDEFIILVDEEGNEELYEIILTFEETEDFNKNYVLVIPANANDNEEDVEVLAFSYEETEDGIDGELSDIETEEEWDMIEEVLGAFMEDDEEEEE